MNYVRRYAAAALGCAALVAVLPAAPAAAGVLPLSLDKCDSAPLSQAFLPWADRSLYKLAPGGDFEGGLAGWSLQGNAGQVSGSELFGVSGTVGSSSLGLPAGSVATSPSTCVDAAYPTFRFFTRSDSPGTTVSVSVLYTTALGQVKIPVGTVTPVAAWEPTTVMVTGSALAGALGGGTANASLQFTAAGGTAQVDDVYVDPWGRCC